MDILAKLDEQSEWYSDGHGELHKQAAAEIRRLLKLCEPSVWTCEHHEGESFSCPDDAMDGAAPGDWSVLEGWARVTVVRATVQPDDSVHVETI
jgi:hypothetical protein